MTGLWTLSKDLTYFQALRTLLYAKEQPDIEREDEMP